jgi:hypothetical protein
MSTDANLTEEEVILARIGGADLDPPKCQVLWRLIIVSVTLVLPDRGSEGRQRGLGGHATSLVVI